MLKRVISPDRRNGGNIYGIGSVFSGRKSGKRNKGPQGKKPMSDDQSINNTVMTFEELDNHLIGLAGEATTYYDNYWGLDDKPALAGMKRYLEQNGIGLVRIQNDPTR